MLQEFRDHISKHFPDLETKKLLVAVSGGLDSMVLLFILKQMNCNILVLHCNFQLREIESDLDEQFVKEYCEGHKIDFISKKMNTKEYVNQHKVSVQLAAREMRYSWFYEVLNKMQKDFICTAHHLDDSLETFLINLSRGTGIDGLLGIPSQNKNVIRPMLCFSRDQIFNFAKANKVPWREDASNQTTKYLRNKFRHDVIPTLKSVQPNLLNNFLLTIQNLQQSQELIEDALQNFSKEVISNRGEVIVFDCQKLLLFPNFKAYLYQILSSYKFTSWNDIYTLIHAQSGKKVLSEGYILLKNREELLLFEKKATDKKSFFIENEAANVKFPINITFLKTKSVENCSTSCIFVDADLLQFPLIIRKWQTGDFFYPIGMKGKKKVSKFFKDKKMSLIDKENIWILSTHTDIIWVIENRMDDRFKVTNETKNILKIEINR